MQSRSKKAYRGEALFIVGVETYPACYAAGGVTYAKRPRGTTCVVYLADSEMLFLAQLRPGLSHHVPTRPTWCNMMAQG